MCSVDRSVAAKAEGTCGTLGSTIALCYAICVILSAMRSPNNRRAARRFRAPNKKGAGYCTRGASAAARWAFVVWGGGAWEIFGRSCAGSGRSGNGGFLPIAPSAGGLAARAMPHGHGFLRVSGSPRLMRHLPEGLAGQAGGSPQRSSREGHDGRGREHIAMRSFPAPASFNCLPDTGNPSLERTGSGEPPRWARESTAPSLWAGAVPAGWLETQGVGGHRQFRLMNGAKRATLRPATSDVN